MCVIARRGGGVYIPFKAEVIWLILFGLEVGC